MTYRDERYDWTGDLRRLESDGLAIYFAVASPKAGGCAIFGSRDSRATIFENSPFSPEELTARRAAQLEDQVIAA